MADETFKIACAMGVQTSYNDKNTTIRDLSGAGLDSTDGFILGAAEKGDVDGFVLPSFEPEFIAVADVTDSLTKQADLYARLLVNGFTTIVSWKGNGATATPSAGEADLETLLPGLETMLECVGLIGANGAAPIVEYTPRHDGSTGGFGPDGSTVYATIKFWLGDLSFVFYGCIVESARFVVDAGLGVFLECDWKVGWHDPATDFADSVTIPPDIDFTTQASLVAPKAIGIAHTWGQVRGGENLVITFTNTIEEAGDFNVAVTGKRLSHASRVITVDGRLYVATADSDFAYQANVVVPTADMSFQIGEVAGASDIINAFKIECFNLQGKGMKYAKVGQAMVVELSGAQCTSTTAGTEFKLTQN
jgi:hypothetical protein